MKPDAGQWRSTMAGTLDETFGAIDIYLFDQLLRGRIHPRDRIMDAGCGWGRNLVYFLREGYDVSGLDPDPDAVAAVRALAAELAPSRPGDAFRCEALQATTFPEACATVVVSSAVLHFARNTQEFDAMLAGTWRLLAPGGLLFCRLASSIGIERRIVPVGPDPRLYRLPEGTTRFLVDEPLLMDYTRRLGGQLLDPLKTTVVQDQRSMTTWVLRKDGQVPRRPSGGAGALSS